jgi:hypothetical protein
MPESFGPPSASDSLQGDRTRPEPRPASQAAVLLANFFAAMNAAGDDAEDEYRAATAALRKDADIVMVEIARADNDCDRRNYPQRWAHVHAAAELRHPAALPFLRNLVLTPIPPEESTDPHSFSTVAEETILRTTAVEGAGALAAGGNRAALDALLEFLTQPSLSVQRAAVQSILKTPRGTRLRKRMEALLPGDRHFLLDLKPIDVREAPQIRRPERKLSEAGRRARIEPAPNLPGDEPQEEGPRERGPTTRRR